ncbi:DNA cytosine methyltransferase [[Kitasatospora] papulosa]|uniref:DNA cytosine methyltransferase n=1 Tax=[Kitasatospora] papulosa TaxID=1464011 RepID=UPI0036A8348E
MAVEAVFGGTTAWVSDIDPGANKILAHHWPDTPNLGDLKAVDWAAVEPVDIYCGGYPCQPFSIAGEKRGTADERHIWPHIAHSLGVLRPRIAVFENVGNHLRLGFDTVLADLARLRFDAEWLCLRASDAGAPHPRRRLILLAVAQDADREPRIEWRVAAPGQEEGGGGAWPDTGGRGGAPADGTCDSNADSWGKYEPAVRRRELTTGRPAPHPVNAMGRLSTTAVEWMMGLPAGHVTDVPGLTRSEELHALGNGVVPQQAEAALRVLAARAGLTRSLVAA